MKPNNRQNQGEKKTPPKLKENEKMAKEKAEKTDIEILKEEIAELKAILKVRGIEKIDPKGIKRFFWNNNREKFAEYNDGTISDVLKKGKLPRKAVQNMIVDPKARKEFDKND